MVNRLDIHSIGKHSNRSYRVKQKARYFVRAAFVLVKKERSVAVTMVGFTTPAVTAARVYFRERRGRSFCTSRHYRSIARGLTMEMLISQHRIDGVLDLTTS